MLELTVTQEVLGACSGVGISTRDGFNPGAARVGTGLGSRLGLSLLVTLKLVWKLISTQELCVFFFFKKDFIHLFFREKGREEKIGRETLMCERNTDRLPLTCSQLRTWPTTQACGPTSESYW